MVHEIPDPDRFLTQVAENLAADGRFMMVEPPFHVSMKDFQKSIALTEKAGLILEDRYKIPLGRTAVFSRGMGSIRIK